MSGIQSTKNNVLYMLYSKSRSPRGKNIQKVEVSHGTTLNPIRNRKVEFPVTQLYR